MRCAKQTGLLRLFIPSQFEGKGSNVTLDTIPPDLFPPPPHLSFIRFSYFLVAIRQMSFAFVCPSVCLGLPRKIPVIDVVLFTHCTMHMPVIFIMDNNLVRLGVSIF
jgi:hypothetical protein